MTTDVRLITRFVYKNNNNPDGAVDSCEEFLNFLKCSPHQDWVCTSMFCTTTVTQSYGPGGLPASVEMFFERPGETLSFYTTGVSWNSRSKGKDALAKIIAKCWSFSNPKPIRLEALDHMLVWRPFTNITCDMKDLFEAMELVRM